MELFFAEYKSSLKPFGPPDDLLVIPLNAMLLLDSVYEGYQIANIADWFGPGDHAAMQGDVETLWNEFKHCYEGENPEYFGYEFHVLATQFVYYQSVVREALKRHRPAEVYCSERFSSENGMLNNVDELATVLRGLVIDEEIGVLRKRCIPKQTFVSSSKNSKISTLGAYLFFRPRTFYLHLLRKLGRSPNKTLPIAYFSQASKGRFLQHVLRTHLGGYAEPIDHFLETPEELGFKYEDKKPAIDALISNFVNYATFFEKYFGKCANMAKGPWKLLLTCDHTSPLGRCLVDSFLVEGKPVAFFSEGVGQQNKEMSRYIENVFYWPRAAIGFLLSMYNFEFYREKGLKNKFLVTGYLGISYDISIIGDLCFKGWFRFRQAWRRSPDKRVIFYALTALSSHNIARFSCEETPHEVLHHLDEFLSQVDFSRYSVIVKLHGRSLCLEQLRALYRDLDVLWFANVPWEVLANVADCTVIFHSSVGLESLSMGKPVLVWNPTGRATFASTYVSTKSSVLMHVKEKTDIPKALERLLDHDREDFKKYDYYLAKSQEVVIPWLKQNLQ